MLGLKLHCVGRCRGLHLRSRVSSLNVMNCPRSCLDCARALADDHERGLQWSDEWLTIEPPGQDCYCSVLSHGMSLCTKSGRKC
jgi:hypothetical protein